MLFSLIQENKKNPVILIISAAIGVVYINFAVYIQQNFLHIQENACAIVSLSYGNLIYFIVSGLIISLIVNLQLIMLHKKIKLKNLELGLVGIGPLLAGLSLICGACSLPILGLVGINTALTFLGQFQFIVKIFSMILILFGLYLSMNQYKNRCVLGCKINFKK
jgi:hypothetical protein